MDNKDRYTFGWSDYCAEHGIPRAEWKPIESNRNYDLEEIIAYIGLAISMSMVIAPMAWVQFIKWVLG